MDIIKTAIEELYVGGGSVGTTPAVLHSCKALAKGVVVRAGTKSLVIGAHSGVTAGTGFKLVAGEQSPMICIDDLSKVWVVGEAADSDYSWIAQ